jgi:hypothetical protein
MLVGAFAGVLRSSSPALFALASGVQWFTLGSTFWGMLINCSIPRFDYSCFLSLERFHSVRLERRRIYATVRNCC